MTAWDIELEVVIPPAAPQPQLDELRLTLKNSFTYDTESTTDEDEEFTWYYGGRAYYMDFATILEVLGTTYREYGFALHYNSADLLSSGYIRWEAGTLVESIFLDDMDYDTYRNRGFYADTWLMTYADDEDEWQSIADDDTSSTLLLHELHEFLIDVHNLDEDEDEILQALAKHPNYNLPYIPLD